MMDERIVIGKIVNTHGLKGAIKVAPLTDDHKRFDFLEYFYAPTYPCISTRFIVEDIHYQGKNVIIKAKDLNTVEEANKLRGKMIEIEREDAINLPDDTYFICDLMDLEVKTVDGDFIGCISDVISTGSNDVYVVKDKEGKQIMIPAIRDVVKRISIEDNYVLIKPIEGLIE